MSIIRANPAAVAAALRALILLSMAFGARVTADQLAAIMVAVESVLAIWTHAKTSPREETNALKAEVSALKGDSQR